MLTKTKSALAGITPAAEGSLKGKQLLCGRTEAHVTRIMGEIDAARITVAQAQDHLNERMVEGVDMTAAADALLRAENRLRALESVLTIARQKHEHAQADRTQAQQQVAIEAEVAAVVKLKRVSLKVDQLFTNLEHLVAGELVPAMNAARDVLSSSTIRPGELYFLAEAPSAFKQLLLLAVHSLIKEGFVPVNMRKYQQWSDCIPDEDFIRSRTREATPTVKDIPSWQAGG